MRPIKAKDLLELDKRLEVVKLQCYPIPEQVIYQAAKNDYSEIPVQYQEIPRPSKCGEWIVEALLGNDRGHYGCYSSDTQVLTEDGWIYWPEVNENTTLAAYNIETGLVNFEKPSAVQRWEYSGKMYHLEGQALDFLVSPDHRMIVQNRKKDGSWTNSYAISAEEVYGKSVRYPTTGNLSLMERCEPITPFDNSKIWALIGFWIGDGDIHTSTNCLRFHLKLTRKIQYLENICKELEIDFYSTENDRYVAKFPNIGQWIKSICLDSDNSKQLPKSYLRLTKDCVYNLLDGLKNSDGTIRSNTWCYSTTSKVLADQLQALASLNDLKFTLNYEVRDNDNHKDLYVLRLTDRLYPRVEINQSTRSRTYNEEWVDYRGQIHCATVSTGALIVRRNGKVAICGNCLEHPHITFSASGYVHNVPMQARTHRIATFDVQSQRYTGRRVIKVAEGELDPEDVFYVRPVGFYVNRKGKKYDWTEENRQRKLERIIDECKEYAEYYNQGVCEEHLRDYLPQAIRQNFVFTMNLRGILHFLDLRAKMDAQLEIQALCEQIAPILKDWAPNVWNYYEEKRLYRARLSP